MVLVITYVTLTKEKKLVIPPCKRDVQMLSETELQLVSFALQLLIGVVLENVLSLKCNSSSSKNPVKEFI